MVVLILYTLSCRYCAVGKPEAEPMFNGASVPADMNENVYLVSSGVFIASRGDPWCLQTLAVLLPTPSDFGAGVVSICCVFDSFLTFLTFIRL